MDIVQKYNKKILRKIRANWVFIGKKNFNFQASTYSFRLQKISQISR